MNKETSKLFIHALKSLEEDAHNTTIEDAIDLNSIPRDEWHLHTGSFIKIPTNIPAFYPADKDSIETALDWLKEHFKMQGSEFYIYSNLFNEDDCDFGISTGFFLEKVPDLNKEQIIQSRIDELYKTWEKTNHADRPGYEKSDAENLIRKLKSGQLFSKHAKTLSVQEILEKK